MEVKKQVGGGVAKERGKGEEKEEGEVRGSGRKAYGGYKGRGYDGQVRRCCGMLVDKARAKAKKGRS